MPVKRRCRNCDKPFEPARRDHWFDTENCRKEFWKHGGVSLTRILLVLTPRIEQMVKAIVRESMKAATAPRG